MKKRIIATVTNDILYDQRMHRICSSLSKTYRVTLVGRRKASTPEHLPEQVYEQVLLPCYFRRGKVFYMEYQLRLFFYLLFQQFDALYAVDLDTLWAGFKVAWLKRKKRIYDAHEYFIELPELENRPFTRWMWKITGKIWIPYSHLCITVNQSLAQILGELYQKPFISIPNYPIEDQSPIVKVHPPPRILLYQGVLNKGRGLEAAIRAIAYLPDWELWLSGEGDLSDALRKLAAETPNGDKVRFLGYVTPEQLAGITHQAGIGLNLLEAQSLNYFYSLANKFFDYVQARLPQITMDFPVYKEHMNKHRVGMLIKTPDVSSLVDAVHQLSEEANWQICHDNCSKAAEEWTWGKIEPILLQQVQQCMDRE